MKFVRGELILKNIVFGETLTQEEADDLVSLMPTTWRACIWKTKDNVCGVDYEIFKYTKKECNDTLKLLKVFLELHIPNCKVEEKLKIFGEYA